MKNASLKLVTDTLNNNWPKCAFNFVNNEETYALKEGDLLPSSSEYLIVDPFHPGWGSDYYQLYIKGQYNGVFYYKSSNPEQPEEPVVFSPVFWNTAMGSQMESGFSVDSPNFSTYGASYSLEKTNIAESEDYPLADSVSYALYGPTFSNIWSVAQLQLNQIFMVADGTRFNMTTGEHTAYLEDENHVRRYWDRDVEIGDRSLLFPGALVLDTKILAIVATYDSFDGMKKVFTHEIFQWGRDGTFVDKKPIVMHTNQYQVIPSSETCVWIADSNIDNLQSHETSSLYKVVTTDTTVSPELIVGQEFAYLSRPFYKNGLDMGTRKFSIRGKNSVGYAFNGSYYSDIQVS